MLTGEVVAEPAEAHKLQEANLLQYLKTNVSSVPQHAQQIHVRQFSHGQSNPTYLVELGAQRYVLRKKPPGRVLASAHAVEREYRVLGALRDTQVPVPAVLCLCEDASVVGTPFYLMQFVSGRVIEDPAAPQLTPEQRAAAYRGMARTLAALHSVEPAAVGLAGYGKATGYCARQVWRWGTQYRASVVAGQQPLPEMLALAAWLRAHLPASDADPSATRISHGDYRLDNLILDPGDTGRVLAVLDWELSTLGPPLADLAYSCMPYHLPQGIEALPALPSQLPAGVPSEADFVAAYCGARGISPPDPATWSFYMALALFRAAAILAGVGARAAQGNASSRNAVRVGSVQVVSALAHRALQLISANTGEQVGHTSSVASGASALRQPAQSAPSPSSRAEHDGRPAEQGNLASGGASTSAPSASQGASGWGSNTSGGGSGAGFDPAPKVQKLKQRLEAFMAEHVLPVEHEFEAFHSRKNPLQRWTVTPVMEHLKHKAKAAGLWNLWLPAHMAAELQPLRGVAGEELLLGAGLTNLEYAHLSQVMGRIPWAAEIFNCSAPDTGNMEVLARYGSLEQQRRWLVPLMAGRIRSCFAMTEPDVASSDATNIQGSIRREGADYIINGKKWWTTGAMHPRCQVCIFMGKTDTAAATYRQQSMVLVPMYAQGVTVVRPLEVFGYDDAPHGHAEVHFVDVRVPAAAMLLGEGRGFEIAQGRLGPGRLHHCMRIVGIGERALCMMVERAASRVAFKRPIAQQGAFLQQLARLRIDLDAARLMVLSAAHELDKSGNKAARSAIAAAKVYAPGVVLRVLDAAIQVHGAAGVCDDFPLASLYAEARTLRIADGPDEVHLGTIAQLEVKRVLSKL